MAETAHTPGPWFVPDQTWARETRIEVEDDIACPGSGGAMSYTTIVCTLGWNRTTPEWEANARLIAAAPALLEALVAMRDHGGEDWVIGKAHAAIARATGEKQ